ncbi:MAG: 7-cyano-7-deazaguanine synthase [Chitinophagaceae bacterium]
MKKSDNSKIALLSLSGGMDSTCLLVKLLKERYQKVICVSFAYGQTHAIEIEKATQNINYLKKKKYAVEHVIFNLESIFSTFSSSLISRNRKKIPQGHYHQNNMQSTVVPNRNGIFSAIIYGQALSISEFEKCCIDISLGIHSGDHFIYPDCTPEFRYVLATAFKIGNLQSENIAYYTPYLHLHKGSILKDCFENCKYLKLDFDTILGNTITSYNPDKEGKSSGKSGADIERIEAFMSLGRRDPIVYQDTWENVVKHAKKIIKQYKKNTK